MEEKKITKVCNQQKGTLKIKQQAQKINRGRRHSSTMNHIHDLQRTLTLNKVNCLQTLPLILGIKARE